MTCGIADDSKSHDKVSKLNVAEAFQANQAVPLCPSSGLQWHCPFGCCFSLSTRNPAAVTGATVNRAEKPL
jgi:hypothetical protein